MNWKHLVCLACGAALLLGACSSNNASGTTGGGNPDPDSGGDDGNGGSDGTEPTELNAANKAYSDAEKAVSDAVEAAREAAATDTPATREAAEKAIEEAREKLADAVKAAQAAAAAAENPKSLGEATRALTRANGYQAAQESELDSAQASFAWYTRELVRYTFANGDVAIPHDGTNVATIKRIPRTIPTSATDDTQIVNPDAFTGKTFKDVMYEDGKEVFSVNDGGDEFKVDGYAVQRGSAYDIDPTIHTGLRLTNAGLVIRTGGSGQDVAFSDPFTHFRGDSTDFRRKITTWANDGDGDADVDTNDGIWGQNGWDLEIAFDQPQTRSVANGVTSWTGNGDFYWRAIVEADAEQQLAADGGYYDSRAFSQPDGYRDLGTYEVWLSNIGVLDKHLEPVAGSGKITCLSGFIGIQCPDDDEYQYLKYAAYGLFVYTPDPKTFKATGGFQAYNGRVGRINTIHFGYSAFGSEDGRKTTDIGEAITSGRFHGHTLAYEISGDQSGSSGDAFTSKLLRGDVILTVNIPKGSGAGTLQGTMNNFQQWNEDNRYWADYVDNFAVALSSADIGDNGAFSGTAQATPSTDLGSSGAGVFKGNFYGPRADADDLEVAGSWSIGAADQVNISKDLYGSFGAKQRR